MSLYEDWVHQKQIEQNAMNARREIEDEIVKSFSNEVAAGKSKTVKVDGFKVKITARMETSIDNEELQRIARDEGLTGHLSTLFKWEPKLKKTVWKESSEEITGPLEKALTTSAKRPSFLIEKISEGET